MLLNENSLGQPIANNEESLKKFYNWFGNSKVVDKQGRPLVVYHGTNANFNTFDIKHFGQSDIGYLGKGFYLTNDIDMAESYADTEFGKIMPLYAKIQNPFIITDRDASFYPEIMREKLEVKTAKEITDKLIFKGYDGVILQYTEDDGSIFNEIVAFTPNQIKSINNSGWNPNSNNIYESAFYKNVNWQDNVRDVYGEIFYKTLQLIIDNDIIGYVDYNVYENEVYVEYIYVEPKWRRSMYGTKIIQKLQSLYPNTEINFGMMTDDGSKLYQSLNKNIVKNDEYIDKVNRLKKILNWLNKYGAVTNKDPDDWSEAEIEYIKKYEPIWRKYYDKKNDIEDWLSNNKESKSFIKY